MLLKADFKLPFHLPWVKSQSHQSKWCQRTQYCLPLHGCNLMPARSPNISKSIQAQPYLSECMGYFAAITSIIYKFQPGPDSPEPNAGQTKPSSVPTKGSGGWPGPMGSAPGLKGLQVQKDKTNNDRHNRRAGSCLGPDPAIFSGLV